MPVEPYMGQIMLFAGEVPPMGWLPCDGRLLNVSDYKNLSHAIGATYGGDGVTNFRLPDLRGRVPMGAGEAPGLTKRRIGQRAGADALTLDLAHMPAHKHVAATTTRSEPIDGTGVSTPSAASVEHAAYVSSAAAVGNTGAARPIDITPPAVVLTWCIATRGIPATSR